ncbi:Tim10/DDP family zinc finger containing protein [Lotmaria passim]
MNLGVKQESFRIETMMTALRNECVNLCCKDFTQAELTKDEVHCIDRCSWRYLHTNKVISNMLDRGSQGSKVKM